MPTRIDEPLKKKAIDELYKSRSYLLCDILNCVFSYLRHRCQFYFLIGSFLFSVFFPSVFNVKFRLS